MLESAAVADGRSGAIAVQPAPGRSIRVGGDLQLRISGADGDYRAGPCRIDTALPLGYPEPTPPGAIDLKSYPVVRMAEVVGTGDPDNGKNRAFWPLFNHIQRHGIAMTSPVEMNYEQPDSAEDAADGKWSMAFLYRRPDMNKTGVEGSITVHDSAPVTVVSVGLRGDYSDALVERGMNAIEEWLSKNPDWKAAGSWRGLYYNGPSLDWWNKWAEIQLPVEPVGVTELDLRGAKKAAVAPAASGAR